MNKLHTKKDAENLLYLLKKSGFSDARLIGSFGKNAEQSMHDIDVLLPNYKKTKRLENKLTFLLEPKASIRSNGTYAENGVTYTDWGGIYFHNTYFGDVDVFFSTKDFDY